MWFDLFDAVHTLVYLFDFVKSIFPIKQHREESLYMRWGAALIILLFVLNYQLLHSYETPFIVANVLLGIWLLCHIVLRMYLTSLFDKNDTF